MKYQVTDKPASNLLSLEKAILKDNVKTLIFLGGNPVHNASSLDWGNLSEKISNKIHLGCSINETTSLSSAGSGASLP